DAIEAVPEGQVIALDGSLGQVWLHPDEVQLTALEAQRVAWQRHRQQVIDAAHRPAVTEDGRRIGIMANISGPDEASRAMALGAEGVGLFRTEFLFMGRTSAPTEEEQFVAYRQVVETMGRRPVIIRTLDIGGDKPLPYLDLEVEDNPYLGWRGLRFCLDRADLFKTQLRAILRAGTGYNVRVMFPMVS
ncbi:MAG: phosphoenolpyruvate--protein phosphotransferase, partial [Deltaproteobacteria bacterium]|nr:phosphoenolpyruvate--protein phosphotransferase [Deltaproteobacteria bacterium]